jgi:hypothetical protein
MGLFKNNNRGVDEIHKRKPGASELAKMAEEAEARGEKVVSKKKVEPDWMKFDENEFANVSKHPINHFLYRQRPKDNRTFFLRRKKLLMKDRRFVESGGQNWRNKRGKVARRRSSLSGSGDYARAKFRAIPPAFHWFQETTGGTSCPACGKRFKTMGEVHRHHVRFHHTLSRQVDNFSLAAPPKRNWPQYIHHLCCDCPCIPCLKFFSEVYLLEPREFFFTKRSIDFGECPKCVCDEIPSVCFYYVIDFEECPKVWAAIKKSVRLVTRYLLLTALFPLYVLALTLTMLFKTGRESIAETRLEYGQCLCVGKPCESKHACCGCPTGCGCYGIWRWKVKTAVKDAIHGRKRRVYVLQKEDNPELTNYPKEMLYVEPEPEPAPLTAKEKRKLAREQARQAHGLGDLVVEDVDTMMSKEQSEYHHHGASDPVALVIER